MPQIDAYVDSEHREQVIALWRTVFGYEARHNEPSLAIRNKLAVHDDLFFVATQQRSVVGTAMAGYDGHRGWLYSIAVHPDFRRSGLGARLVRHAEAALIARGCVKINLQLLAANQATSAFYAALGYSVEPRISMGKVIPENVPAAGGT